MILPYIYVIGINQTTFWFLLILNVSLVHVWWFLFVSGVPGNSLGFHNPNVSDTGSETFLVPNYTIRYGVRGFFLVANFSNTTKKMKIPGTGMSHCGPSWAEWSICWGHFEGLSCLCRKNETTASTFSHSSKCEFETGGKFGEKSPQCNDATGQPWNF